MSSHLLDRPKGNRYLLYSKLKTAFFQCEADPRASFCLYIPTSHPVSQLYNGQTVTGKVFPLVVLIHHTYINVESMRNYFSDWAETQQCVLLSVLFPFAFKKDGEFADYYKYMNDPSPSDPVLYDRLILDMINTVDREWGSIDTRTFCIAGYSAGGQAAHRFLYLHPDKVRAAAIGAPGGHTCIDSTKQWPEGTADCKGIFGVEVTHERLGRSKPKVQLCIGEKDTGGRDGATSSRPEILDAIAKDLALAGVEYERVIVPGIDHEGFDEAYTVQMEFLERHLR